MWDHSSAKKILPHPEGTLKKMHFTIMNCLPFSSIKWLSDVRYLSFSCNLIIRWHHLLGNYILMSCTPKRNLHVIGFLVLMMASTTTETENKNFIKTPRCSLSSYWIVTEEVKYKCTSYGKGCYHHVLFSLVLFSMKQR